MSTNATRSTRCVTVVDRLELDANVGTVLPDAVCVGDVDDDGIEEVCVGNTDGLLFVFKPLTTRPWCQWSASAANEGASEMVSCLSIGDPCDKGRDFLIALTTAGWIHLFDVGAETEAPKSRSSSFNRPARSFSNTMTTTSATGKTIDSFLTVKDGGHGDVSSDNASMASPLPPLPPLSPPDMKPVFSQRFSFNFNAKIVTVTQMSMTSNSLMDARLVVAYADRVVRLFAWSNTDPTVASASSGPPNATSNVASATVTPTPVTANPATPVTVSPTPGNGPSVGLCSPFEELPFNLPNVNNGGTDVVSNATQDSESGEKDGTSRCSSFSCQWTEPSLQGSFRPVFVWTLAAQISSMALPPLLPGCGNGVVSTCQMPAEDFQLTHGPKCCCDRILVSQPGGALASLIAREESTVTVQVQRRGAAGDSASSQDTVKESHEASPDLPEDDHHPLQGLIRLHAIDSRTKSDRYRVAGCASRILCLCPNGRRENADLVVVVVTVDGLASVFDMALGSGDSDSQTDVLRLRWAKRLDHQICYLHLIECSSDGVNEGVGSEEEVVPLVANATWDGQVVVFDLDGEIWSIYGEEPVAAFATGRFGPEWTSSSMYSIAHFPTSPSLLLVTVTGRIFVFSMDFNRRRLVPSTLMSAVAASAEASRIKRLLEELGLKREREWKDFVHFALYSTPD